MKKKKAPNLGGRPRASARGSTFDVRIGERIKARRQATSLTQSVLAGKVGKSLAQVCRYESGDSPISGVVLARIAEVLGCTTGYFLDGIKA